jgi:hypothetical protein
MTSQFDLNDHAPEFIPVPMARFRHDGWTPKRQRMFLAGLTATGTVHAAARMVGMSRKSAYALRNREGAESFGAAWDLAIDIGRSLAFDYAMDRALNGVATLRLRLGGVVDVSHGHDGKLITDMRRSKVRPPQMRKTKVT